MCEHQFINLIFEDDSKALTKLCTKCGALKVGNSVIVGPDFIDLASLVADPSLAVGRLWYRSDTAEFRVVEEGEVAKTISTLGPYAGDVVLEFAPEASSNPSTAIETPPTSHFTWLHGDVSAADFTHDPGTIDGETVDIEVRFSGIPEYTPSFRMPIEREFAAGWVVDWEIVETNSDENWRYYNMGMYDFVGWMDIDGHAMDVFEDSRVRMWVGKTNNKAYMRFYGIAGDDNVAALEAAMGAMNPDNWSGFTITIRFRKPEPEWEMVPVTDEDKGNWVEGAGDGDGDAYDEMDEGSPGDEATTYWTSIDNSNVAISFKLTAVEAPGNPAAVMPRWLTRGHSNPVNIRLQIWEGVPDVGTLRFTDGQTTTVDTWVVHAPGGDLSAVTDWGNLYVRVGNLALDAWFDLSMISIKQS